MSSVTYRAEQALFGALMADREPPEALRDLDAGDFGGREHRALYTEIMTVRETAPALRGDALIDAVARHTGSGDIGLYLEDLRDRCPDPEHVVTYARLVQAAALRREAATAAERLAVHAAREPDTESGVYAGRLAKALLAQARRHQALITEQQAGPLNASGEAPAASASRDPRAQQEDELLADLMHNPRQARNLARFLPPEAFTDPQREEVYRVMVSLAEAGDPIDEVIVSWQMANLRAIEAKSPPEGTGRPAPADPDDAYLARLAATHDTTSAVQIGADLLAEDLRTNNGLQTGGVSQALTPPGKAPKPTAAPDVTAHPGPAPLDPGLGRPANTHTGPAPRLTR